MGKRYYLFWLVETSASAEWYGVHLTQLGDEWVDLMCLCVNKAASVHLSEGWWSHIICPERVICPNRSVNAPLRVNGRDAKQWVCAEEMCPWEGQHHEWSRTGNLQVPAQIWSMISMSGAQRVIAGKRPIIERMMAHERFPSVEGLD